jgi:hypothetical protein
VTSGMPAGPVSESVLVARRKLEGIRSAAAAQLADSSQRAMEADRKAAEANKNFTENVKKLEGRVREMAEKRAAEARARGPKEIKTSGADDDAADNNDLPSEYRDIASGLSVRQAAAPAPAPARPEPTAPARAASDWMPSDSPVTADALLAPTADPEPTQQQASGPDPRWQVQAGRFGRRKQPESPRPAARKPTRTQQPQPAHDDEDFENQSWLR